MADPELFQASTSQLSFEKFINTINQDQAKDLVRSINQFMKKFRSRPPVNEIDSREVQEFLTSMEQSFARHPLWAGSTRSELDNAVEGLEKYLLTKLYDRTFGLDPLDRERDAVLSRRLAALAGFITPAHLEVSEQLQVPLATGEGGHVVAASKELKKMSLYKSPRDKLVQILNCCKIISDFITSRRAGAGADDFTPTLIYVTIKAQPEALASNLSFIERYRHSTRLNGEASYFFVQMQGAVAFLETLSPTSLAGCEPDEFISHMLAAGAMSEQELSEEQQQLSVQHPMQPTYYAGYPPGTVLYSQPMPYYVQYGTTPVGMPYSQPWVAAPSPGAAAPPPPPPGPPPPPLTPPPPPTTATVAAVAAIPAVQQQQKQFIPPRPKSVSELERDGIRLVIKAEAAGELRAKYPYLYCIKESLTLHDVSQLLVSYKELVLRYETLAQAVENNVVKYFTELEAFQAGLPTEPLGTTAAAAWSAAPPPPPPPPPPSQRLPPEPGQDLTSRRCGNAPPQPPQPPQSHYPSSVQMAPLVPAVQPPPPPPPEPARTRSAAGARGLALDLSQYMPSYQLETEGYAYEAEVMAAAEAAEAATAAAAVVASPTGISQPAAPAASATAAPLIDLLSDYTPAPPTATTTTQSSPSPLSPAESVQHYHHQHQQADQELQQQQQQQQQLSPSISFGGEDEGDDYKKLTPPGSVRNTSVAELGAATAAAAAETAPSTQGDDGVLAAMYEAAAVLAPSAAPSAEAMYGSCEASAGGGDAAASLLSDGAPASFSTDGQGPTDNGGAAAPSLFLEATLSPPQPPPPPPLEPLTLPSALALVSPAYSPTHQEEAMPTDAAAAGGAGEGPAAVASSLAATAVATAAAAAPEDFSLCLLPDAPGELRDDDAGAGASLPSFSLGDHLATISPAAELDTSSSPSTAATADPAAALVSVAPELV
ncbi:hypothetical protein VOLCADRAFT_119357, partial [Volvox carteri f. nagariensis]